MTGYASAQQGAGTGPDSAAPAVRLGLEIRSVNGRFLDFSLRLSEELRTHEPALRELVQGRLKRGKVELRAFVESSVAGHVAEPSPRLLQRLNTLQDSVKSWLPEARGLSVADILKLAAGERGGGQDWGPVLQTLGTQALDAMVEARRREGERLAGMLLGHIAQLRQLATQAGPMLPLLV